MDSYTMIIFGVTGNLSQKKLLPALYSLEAKNLISPETRIVGIARKPLAISEFGLFVEATLRNPAFCKAEIDSQVLARLVGRLHYIQGDFEQNDDAFYQKLGEYLNSNLDNIQNHLYYFATYPSLYASIFASLKKHGLNSTESGWVRLMIEKPIGHDLASARSLDTLLHQYFDESQIFRLDHYLGKETLQNILVFRFGNGLLAPLMNRDHVDHIQIIASEEFGIGSRGGYYDTVGALRDVGQNHLLQMLAVATMGAPAKFNNEEVTKKRVEILENLKAEPKNLVYGQYNGYLFEEKVDPQSNTNTYFAFKTEIDNETWRGVPIYVRGGKKLARSTAEISIVFKEAKNSLFGELEQASRPNVLTYRIQPNEGIGLELLTKRPDHKFVLESNYMQFCYRDTAYPIADAYENLLYDAILGDGTFFNDSVEVEASWKFIDELASENPTPHVYEPGSWGPKEADELIERDGRKWLEPSEALCGI